MGLSVFQYSKTEELKIVTDHLADYPDTPISMIIAFNIGRLCALISIPLHCMVIGAVIRYRKTDNSMKNSYFHMLANLCAIDLIRYVLSCVLGNEDVSRVIQLLALKTFLYTMEGWRTSNETALPRFDGVCQFFAYQANLFQLTAIALNRLLEMALPLKAKTIWTSKITVSVNIGSWLCGIAFAAPLLSSVHKLEHLPLYQGIFWSNDWDNQSKADVDASKAYMDVVSKGGLIFSGLLLGTYLVTFCIMIKYRLSQTFHGSQRYKAEVDLTIQALMLTSFVFLYNICLFLYTRECCPQFVSTTIVAMLWAAHYSGPMLALALSNTLRRNVKRLFAALKNILTITGNSSQHESSVTYSFSNSGVRNGKKRVRFKKRNTWAHKENTRCPSIPEEEVICHTTVL